MKGSMEPDVFVRSVEDCETEGSIPCQEVRKRELQAVICMQRLGSKTLKWEILQGRRTQHPLQHEGADLSTEVSETNLVDTVVPFI